MIETTGYAKNDYDLDKLDALWKKAYVGEWYYAIRNAYPAMSADLRRLAKELAESYKIIQIWQESYDELTGRVLAEEGDC